MDIFSSYVLDIFLSYGGNLLPNLLVMVVGLVRAVLSLFDIIFWIMVVVLFSLLGWLPVGINE